MINSKIEVKTRKATTETHELRLTGSAIRELLANSGVHVPQGASVYVAIPGGGDWSNTDLSIEGDTAIEIRWTETTHEQ